MKKTLSLLTILFSITQVALSQDYMDYMQQGKYYYNRENFVSALEHFDLAYESANSETRKKDAKIWKTNSFKSLENQQKKMKKQLESNSQVLSYSKKLINVFYFYDGRIALAYKEGKYGYVYKNGETAIPFKYDQATPFEESNGFATVYKNGERFLVDTTGREYHLASNSKSLNGKTEALDLRNQQLSEIPKYVFNYVGLKILLLSNNNLSNFPDEIIQLKELTHLDASGNKIQELPEKIGKFLKLQQLSLQNNFINRLPEDIVFVKELRKLDLTNNKLYSLPNNMGSMYFLNTLKLDGNEIANLPEDIGQLRNLKVLSLRNNSLTKLTAGISELYHLQRLFLDQNEITDLPQEISRLPQLEELSLSRNRLGYLPTEIKQLASLKLLDLKGNPISGSKKSMIENWLPNCSVNF